MPEPPFFSIFCCPLVTSDQASFSLEQVGMALVMGGWGGPSGGWRLGATGKSWVTAFFYPTWNASLHPACLGLGFLKADPETRLWVLLVYVRGGLKALE